MRPGVARVPGGYREILALAVPLVLSTGATSLQIFVDRMFLTWWRAPDALAAAMPAGLLHFTVLSLFTGTAAYVGTFVAQYHGAGRPERVGPAAGQGIYVALLAGLALLAVRPAAEGIFRLAGHDVPGMRAVFGFEVVYFRTLCLGAFPAVLASALAGYWSGLGRTWPILWVNAGATAVNLGLDWLLVFGRFGLPEMGIRGAAVATNLSAVFACAVYASLLLRKGNDRLHGTRRGWRPDREILLRLFRYGFPSGVHLFLDIAGFTVFLLLVGRLGGSALAATNLAFNVNALAFIPMIGLGVAVSVLVGQYVGRERTDVAAAVAWRSLRLATGFMGTIALGYFLVPDLFLAPYAAGVDPRDFAEVREQAAVLLRFVAVYSLADALNIVFAGAVKGAGDTRFVMVANTILSIVLLVIPAWVSIVVLRRGILTAWTICTVYIVALGVLFLGRFLAGKWKGMRVIEGPGYDPGP